MKNKKQLWIALSAGTLFIAGIALSFFGIQIFDSGNFALQYFAAGDFACGVFAAGTFTVGIFSIGIFSIGIFSIGIFNIGLYAIGIFMLTRRSNRQNSLINQLRETVRGGKTTLMILLVALPVLFINAQEPARKGFSIYGGFGGPMVSLSSFQGMPAL